MNGRSSLIKERKKKKGLLEEALRYFLYTVLQRSIRYKCKPMNQFNNFPQAKNYNPQMVLEIVDYMNTKCYHSCKKYKQSMRT